MNPLQKNTLEIFAISRRAVNLMVEDYLAKYLFEHPKYQNPKRVTQYEYKGYSQHGEDGIIREIFHRIGTTNKHFMEFGVGKHGLENNTVFLLLQGWKGGWIETKPQYVEHIKEKYKTFVNDNTLTVKSGFVMAENVEDMFKQFNLPKEPDLLSIDIDGNDYWVWKAVVSYNPRVVVIEYNSMIGCSLPWIMKYNRQHKWNGTSYFGASLKSMELLGLQKGYKLVGCEFTGVNAFFVREDLVGDKFLAPFTSENHYEPPRLFLERTAGYARDFGEFER